MTAPSGAHDLPRLRRKDVVEAAHSHATRMQVRLRFGRHRTWLPQLDVIAIPRQGRRRIITLGITGDRRDEDEGASSPLPRIFSWDTALSPVACIVSAEAWKLASDVLPGEEERPEMLIVAGLSYDACCVLEARLVRLGGVILPPTFHDAPDGIVCQQERFARWAEMTLRTGRIDVFQTCHDLISAAGSLASAVAKDSASHDQYRVRIQSPEDIIDERTFDRLRRLLRFDEAHRLPTGSEPRGAGAEGFTS